MAESGTASGTPLALELVKRVHDIAEKVEPIRNLDRVGSSKDDSISDRKTTVARDDLGARMRSKPGRQRGGLIVREDINGPPIGKVNQ
jgi:hypothetical protein